MQVPYPEDIAACEPTDCPTATFTGVRRLCSGLFDALMSGNPDLPK